MNALDELEEIKELVNNDKHFKYKNIVNFNCEHIKEELESIDNAEPSEALKCILDIKNNYKFYVHNKKDIDYQCNTIKQALLNAQENVRSEEILQKYYQEGITLDSVRELKKENEVLKEILKSFFDRGCPLHQYTDKDGMLLIEVDNECSTMHLGKFKGVDLDAKLKEVLE